MMYIVHLSVVSCSDMQFFPYSAVSYYFDNCKSILSSAVKCVEVLCSVLSCVVFLCSDPRYYPVL